MAAEVSQVNGVDLVTETSSALPLVSISVSFRPGSLLDAPERAGQLRLCAALMRRCSADRSAEATELEIDSMGAALAVDVSHSIISFYGTVIGRSLDRFVNLMVDVLSRTRVDADELKRLVRETESELVDLRDNDRALCRYWFKRRLFPGHAYSQPVIGTIDTILKTKHADAAALIAQVTHLNACVTTVAGDVQVDTAQAIAHRIAASLKPQSAVLDPPDPSIPLGRRLLIIDKPERTQTQILIGTLGTHPRDEDHFALTVANTVFGGTFTARMTQAIRAERGWSYGAYSSLPYDRRRQAFSMWTFPKNEDAAPCLTLELDLLQKWVDQGVTQQELAWAKNYLVRSHAFAVDTASKRAGLAADELLYSLPQGYYGHYRENIESVTLEQVNQAISRRIDPGRLMIAVLGTKGEILAGMEKAIPNLSELEVVAYDQAD